MWNKNAPAVAAADSVDLDRWQDGFSEVIDRIAPRFARFEPLRHAAALIQGLLAPLERKNCWTIAEHRGQQNPHALQHLLGRAKWDADGVRDDLRGFVVDHLGDPEAVLVIDETGDVKKGTASVGVQRQYTGTAGRVENAQVAVYLTYAAPRGHAFIDRALYLPKVWAQDADRRTAGGVPAEVEFATKPALARAMLDRAVDGEVPARWVAGDEVYGADPQLRASIRGHGLGYVLQVASNRQVLVPSGAKIRADELAAMVPATAWQRYSAGVGTKGPRWYSWAPGAHPQVDPARAHSQAVLAAVSGRSLGVVDGVEVTAVVGHRSPGVGCGWSSGDWRRRRRCQRLAGSPVPQPVGTPSSRTCSGGAPMAQWLTDRAPWASWRSGSGTSAGVAAGAVSSAASSSGASASAWLEMVNAAIGPPTATTAAATHRDRSNPASNAAGRV